MSSIYFSFCIYGQNLIYFKGLLDNLEILSKLSNPVNVIISYDSDILQEYKTKYEEFDFVKLVKIQDELLPNYKMCSRITNLDLVPKNSYVFCRDADSRITKRDLWCIEKFQNSGAKLHIIRDHYYHKQRVMGGMCGFFIDNNSPSFSELLFTFINNTQHIRKDYGFDEAFFSNVIYKLFTKEEILIHSSSIGFQGEKISIINLELEDDSDFIGNVYNLDNSTQFRYSHYISIDHLKWLESQSQPELILFNKKYININKQPWNTRQSIYNMLLNAAINSNNLIEALNLINEFDNLLVDENMISNTNRILDLAKRHEYKIIATSNLEREPVDDEIIIYYGQYPHSVECIPNPTRKVYRHAIYFKDYEHSSVEYHPCWEAISTIYILNLEERKDRYYSILVELCRVQAPLNRVYHYKAQKESYTGNRQQDIYIGASNNHLEVTQHFIKSGNKTCLILEDDITFISDTKAVFESIEEFIKRDVSYDICFIAYSKQGEIKKYDDLLLLSYQECTTSSAYFLRSDTAHEVENCLRVGVEQMKKGETPNIYCCDRYWAILQPRNKMFLFKKKIAFQTITYSSIVSRINYCFD